MYKLFAPIIALFAPIIAAFAAGLILAACGGSLTTTPSPRPASASSASALARHYSDGSPVSYPPVPSSDCFSTESEDGVAPPGADIVAHELGMWILKCDGSYAAAPITCVSAPEHSDAQALAFDCTIETSPRQTAYIWANRKNGSWIEAEPGTAADYPGF
jgi:hypothetical protein